MTDPSFGRYETKKKVYQESKKNRRPVPTYFLGSSLRPPTAVAAPGFTEGRDEGINVFLRARATSNQSLKGAYKVYEVAATELR